MILPYAAQKLIEDLRVLVQTGVRVLEKIEKKLDG